ncbi:cytoplasmic dynein 1 light intermediate chain 2-like [Tachypleus tridentatus]|uniref:cytoplasmic dynein 1 light intermediate chain 2-like n=1 Tax=Tachypleus tridentatus TaxID=6853 RepID=UPI003FD00DF5
MSALKRFQEYIEPRDEIENATKSVKKILGSKEETISLSLDEITLTNIGLDLIVVVTKTDFMFTSEKECDYKDVHFDFIQQALRKFCLRSKYLFSAHLDGTTKTKFLSYMRTSSQLLLMMCTQISL